MRVLLVQMPFFNLDMPSISLSLVRSCLNRAGIPAHIRYLNIELGKRLGVELYTWIVRGTPSTLMLPDLLFASGLFGGGVSVDRLEQLAAPLRSEAKGEMLDYVIEMFPRLTAEIQRFLDGAMNRIAWSDYDLIGINLDMQPSQALFEVTPSLALAQAIKQLPSAPPVLLGGKICEGEMGEQLVRSFPFVDFVIRGEPESATVELAASLGTPGRDLAHIEGLIWRDNQIVKCNGRSARRAADLDALPIPDYDDWMEQIRAAGLSDVLEIRMPIETSRGCWFGEKMHCTFCGLVGEEFAFRSKSPARVIAEFKQLRRYGAGIIHAIDEIFDHRYFTSLLPELSELKHGAEVWYEIKSNLSYEQLRLLKSSGIIWLQPGIESLSTPVLKQMRKGVTGFQNVRLLKWAAQLGLSVGWNLLYGFPGERSEDFLEMIRFIPSLSHLQPPLTECLQVRLHRFSPMFKEPELHGLKNLKPIQAYSEIFPIDERALSRLAYYFDHEYSVKPRFDLYVEPLRNAIRSWHAETGNAVFCSIDSGEKLLLFDTRRVATQPSAVLQGIERAIYKDCEHGTTVESLYRRTGLPSREVERILDSLSQRKWLLELDGHLLALAVPMDAYIPPYMPASLAGTAVQEMYRAQMARIHNAFVSVLPAVPNAPVS